MRCRKRIIVRSDDDVERDVQDALVWGLALFGSAIGVAVGGIAMLIGRVKSDMQQLVCERETKRVTGVPGCVDEVCRAPHDRSMS